MDKQAFIQATADIDDAISKLQQQRKSINAQYVEQFPKVGQLVLYKGEMYRVYRVTLYGDGAVRFDLRKPKKDGTPSGSGALEYLVSLDEIQLIEAVSQVEA